MNDGYTFATLVVTAANAPAARALSAGLSSGGIGMFTAALSATGKAPATHYVSTGYFVAEYMDALASADALYAKATEQGATVSLALCQKLINESDVSDENPFNMFDRMGLQLVQEDV